MVLKTWTLKISYIEKENRKKQFVHEGLKVCEEKYLATQYFIIYFDLIESIK